MTLGPASVKDGAGLPAPHTFNMDKEVARDRGHSQPGPWEPAIYMHAQRERERENKEEKKEEEGKKEE